MVFLELVDLSGIMKIVAELISAPVKLPRVGFEPTTLHTPYRM